MKPTQIAKELMFAYAQEGRLLSVHCDLLYQCDLDCGHCYLDDKSTRNQGTEFWIDVLDQVAEMGALSANFSGGEIFLRPDLMQILAHARRLGLFVSLKTHGGLITDEIAAELRELDVFNVQVSYYSPSPEVHDRITRRPGSHQATLRGLQALARHGVPTSVACCAMGPNAADLQALREQCESMGIPLQLEFRIQDALGGQDYPQDLALDIDDLQEAMADLQAVDSLCDAGVSSGDSTWSEGKICTAGQTLIYISPEGDVTPCLSWPQPLGNLGDGSRIADLWEHAPLLSRMRAYRNMDREGCGTCDSSGSCSYCPGQAYVEHGDPMRPATAVCNDAYARASAVATAQGNPRPASPPGLSNKRFQVLTTQQVERASQESTLP